MESVRISIIIPVYQVEKYLRRCVESALEQTLQSLEIILVDDGSLDHCPEICDEYAKRDDRIMVIHKKNGGLSSARNAGMHAASGKYLFFLDSDDWLEKDGMEKLYETAEKYQVDFVRYRAIRTGWPGLAENTPCMTEQVRELSGGYYDKERIRTQICHRLIVTPELTMGAIVGAWGALYNRQFLTENDLYFEEQIKYSEDMLFSARVVRAAESFYYVEEACVYHYFYNPDSISKSFRMDRWASCKCLIRAFERDFAKDRDYDYGSQLHCLRWFCICMAFNERRYLKDDKEKAAYCKRLLQDPVIAETALGFSQMKISCKQKLWMILVKLKLGGLIARI